VSPCIFFFGTTKKVYLLLITMPPKKKPVNVSNKTKPAIVTVRKSSRTTPVKNKEKVNNILSLLFPCYYQLYAYSRVRNLNLPLLYKLRFLFFLIPRIPVFGQSGEISSSVSFFLIDIFSFTLIFSQLLS